MRRSHGTSASCQKLAFGSALAQCKFVQLREGDEVQERLRLVSSFCPELLSGNSLPQPSLCAHFILTRNLERQTERLIPRRSGEYHAV